MTAPTQPTGVQYRRLTGWMMNVSGDPVLGTVYKFEAVPNRVYDTSATPAPIINTDPVYGRFGADHVMRDQAGDEGVWIVDPNDPTLSPTGFNYRVTVEAPGCKAESFNIDIPAGSGDVDLATVMPVDPRLGTPNVKGEKGDKGDKGTKGDTGNTGPKGNTGPQGETGPKGNTGAKGDKGDQGTPGIDGTGSVSSVNGQGPDQSGNVTIETGSGPVPVSSTEPSQDQGNGSLWYDTSMPTGADPAAIYAQLHTTDTTTDLNTTSVTMVPWTVENILDAGFTHPSGDDTRLAVTDAGTYLVSTTISVGVASANNRTSLQTQVYLNGNPLDGIASSFYMRGQDGVDSASGSLSILIEAAAGDYIQVGTKQDSVSTEEVTLRSGGSMLSATKISALSLASRLKIKVAGTYVSVAGADGKDGADGDVTKVNGVSADGSGEVTLRPADVGAVESLIGDTKLWRGTQAAYDGLSPASDTVYIIQS